MSRLEVLFLAWNAFTFSIRDPEDWELGVQS